MEQRQKKNAQILKYAKRRFDGGQEVDLIKAIERQHQREQLNRLYGQSPQEEVKEEVVGVSSPLSPAEAIQLDSAPVPGPAPSKVWEAFIMGPLQVAIGSVGMLTALLAIATFSRVQNDVMLQQGKIIFSDCAKTFRKGIWDTLTTPVRVLKAACK